MPRLSELTDFSYNDPTGAVAPALPAEIPPELKRVYITGEEPPVKFSEEPQVPAESSPLSNNIDKILNSIFRTDEKRLQLWPEKMLRHGVTAAGDVASGKVPTMAIDPVTGDVHTSPEMIEKAQEVASLAGTGGLASGGGSLNATPSLRPALKYKDKLYKGKPGQEHMDVIPADIYPTFQKQAMSGEDISNFNFGFINDKGHFLSREDALKYGIDNGLIDPQAGKYGALTSTLFADSSKPGVAIEAMKTANPFFSALEHNVGKISQGKMTGDQWLGTLSNKSGVKPEEMQWTGLSDFLAENKGKPVTKAQIEEHLASNKVELKEVTKGTGELKKAAEDLQAAIGPKPITLPGWKNSLYADEIEQALWSNDITPKDLPVNLQPHAEKMLSLRHQQEQPTKYHSYQLPGGENYREMLLTLPEKKGAQQFGVFHKERQLIPETFATAAEARQAAKALRESGGDVPVGSSVRETGEGSSPYRSSHWDEPNILAHVRMNDRTIDGKKSLHLEEIQSDWHQQGRDKGYKQPVRKLNEKELDEYDTLANKEKRTASENTRFDELQKLADNQEANAAGVPDAPFKKSWHELALKRMLREASEKGYDRLSWTPGEAQAARYDLSKSIDELVYFKDNKLQAFKDGKEVFYKHVPEAELPNAIGKEAADKLLKSEKKTGDFKELKGQDLKIGGEGMKGFYDQIIPKSLEKLGKEHGVKIKKADVIADSQGWHITPPEHTVSGKWMVKSSDYNSKGLTFDTKAEAEAAMRSKLKKAPVYYIDIPQSLKDTATQKGFPLFSKGGYMFQPVDFNPFEGKTELKT